MKTALLALLVLQSAGCFRIEVHAPHGRPVRLLAREEAASIERQRRTWFALLGCVPLDDTMPASIIHAEDLEEVRVRVTDTIPDAVIGFFQTIILQESVLAQTYLVLGNRHGAPAANDGTPAKPTGD